MVVVVVVVKEEEEVLRLLWATTELCPIFCPADSPYVLKHI